MAFGKRNRNSWGPSSFSKFHTTQDDDIDNDDEDKDDGCTVEEYTERMVSAQLKQLDPLKEDLADWLNKTLDIDYINGENFLTQLDNGVILCHLAQIVCDRAKYAKELGLVDGPLPMIRSKCFEKAMRRSFFSRDNMENFIKFCKSLGIHENLLFESDDLVLHNQPRNVIVCLLEVARIATTRYGMEPPGLIELEKEIIEEERKNNSATASSDSGLSSLLSWQFQTIKRTPTTPRKMKHSKSASAIPSSTSPPLINNNTNNDIKEIPPSTLTPPPPPSDQTTEDEWSRGSGDDPDSDATSTTTANLNNNNHNNKSGGSTKGSNGDVSTELDRKVQLATRLMQKSCNCSNGSGKCSRLEVKKVGEGKYNIAGKNVFVRLLKGRHMMVRVGGGWDTLDHFLLRHDPCQVKVVSRDKPPPGTPTTAATPPPPSQPSSASKFLHIRAKYHRSPPPPTRRESVAR